MDTSVTPTSLRAAILKGLQVMAALSSDAVSTAINAFLADDAQLQAAIDASAAEVEQTLSTRFTPTRMRGWFGPGAFPTAASGEEWESSFDYPGRYPGNGFQVWDARVRPIKSVNAGSILLPGVTMEQAVLDVTWFRYQSFGEILMAPSLFGAPFVSSGAIQSLLGFARGRIPQAIAMDYVAGCDDTDLARWPQLNRMVELKAVVRLLPALAGMMNPEGFTSVNADGLSQSRGNGYVFQDWEKRMTDEIDAKRDEMFRLWDGPGLVVL
jgi:hypothetical protein